MNWAHHRSIYHWPVNFTHLLGRAFTLYPDDNAVGMEEILNGCAFPEELRV
jgi:hypothetical protein